MEKQAESRPYISIGEPDRSEILDLVSAYTWLFDEERIDELARLFTEDAVVMPNFGPDLPEQVVGVADIRDFYGQARRLDRENGLQIRHFSTNPLFSSRSGDDVEVSTNMLFTHFGNGNTQVQLIGRYHFSVTKRDGQWFIQKVSLAYDL